MHSHLLVFFLLAIASSLVLGFLIGYGFRGSLPPVTKRSTLKAGTYTCLGTVLIPGALQGHAENSFLTVLLRKGGDIGVYRFDDCKLGTFTLASDGVIEYDVPKP
ncbi:MAG: hypothetical protein ABIT47_01585 [Candidatus Paceibacterota bacterium]